MTDKPKKPKKLAYELLHRDRESGRGLYALLDDLVEQFHEDLKAAKIALAWNKSWQPDVDGRVILGKCRKASDLDRELVDYDFVIILRKEFMTDPSVSDDQRRALLDHELCHACLKVDGDAEPVEDERGRKVYRTRKHDIEEFSEIIARHGCYKRDLEQFAAALEKARHQPANQWVGYRTLQDLLATVDIAVPLDIVHTWLDVDRRAVRAWAILRKELSAATPGAMWTRDHEAAMPACLAAALPKPEPIEAEPPAPIPVPAC